MEWEIMARSGDRVKNVSSLWKVAVVMRSRRDRKL